MITTILLHVSLVLAGIILLSFIFFLIAYISQRYAGEGLAYSGKLLFSPIRPEIDIEQPEKTIQAIILCNQIPPSVPKKFLTSGYTDCRTQNMVFNGNLVCEYGCLGLGSCARICPEDAIILKNGTVFITESCNGCGKCLNICPKGLIIPLGEKMTLLCAACGKTDASTYCVTAREGYSIDFHDLPKSGFKILNKWAILGNKKGYW